MLLPSQLLRPVASLLRRLGPQGLYSSVADREEAKSVTEGQTVSVVQVLMEQAKRLALMEAIAA